MTSAIRDLVSMRDVETLAEILNDSDDWLDQIDAAEGLLQLGDRRGLDYLLITSQSDMGEIADAAQEVLLDPQNVRMREQVEAEIRFASRKLVEQAHERLKQGKKVFLHKVLYVPAAELLRDDRDGQGFEIFSVNDAGLEGWEMVNVVPRRQVTGPGEKAAVGAYVFLKKELAPGDAGELEKS